MKRTLSLLLLSILFVCSWAQTNPNRLIVVDKSGSYQGYLVERIDSLMFVQVEGRVAADIEFLGFTSDEDGDVINLAITRTPDCYSFQICVIPTNTMAYLRDEAALANYVQRQGGQRYYQDFTDAQMSGFDFVFQPNAEYTIVTLGYDGYGVACSTDQVSFTTPAPAIVGNPYVECTVLEVTATSFMIDFQPNADVQSYSMCSFIKGEAEQQFNMWGPMFGFASIEQMVYQWGIPQTTDFAYEWTRMDPDTEYEVLVAMKDANGNFAPLISVPVKTLLPGGQGIAEISILIGALGGTQESGYYQNVMFIPNAECGVYHAMIVQKEYFEEEGEDFFISVLQSDTNPFNPWDSYWNLVGVDDGYWNVDPNTTYYAIAMGKNGNGEWGEFVKEEFTTPSAAQSAPAHEKVAPRKAVIRTEGPTHILPAIQTVKATKGITIK